MLFFDYDTADIDSKISFSCEAVKLHFEEYYPEGPEGRNCALKKVPTTGNVQKI